MPAAPVVERITLSMMWRRLTSAATPYLYIAPFFLVFGAFGLYPTLYAFQLSFTRWHGIGEPKFIGLANYSFLLHSETFWSSVENSLIVWCLVVPAQILLSIAVASQLSRRLRFRSFYRVAFLVPYLVPLVAIAQVWLILFDRGFGAVNTMLHQVGLPTVGWLTDPMWAKPTLALLVFWKGFGFSMLIMLAAIQSIPTEMYEAAALDGASGVAQLRYITVPQLRRTTTFFLVVATLGILQMFAEPYVLTRGGPYGTTITVGYALYKYTINLDLGTGAANSFLLIIAVGILAFLMLRLMLRRREP
jgi:multiple sugar transport system permease protein/lactose/L-arabinose transport system permease protein/cellobiose transport system permease protein